MAARAVNLSAEDNRVKSLTMIAAVFVLVLLIACVAQPAGAVTWLTVNGLTSGTINTPGAITVRCNTASASATVRFVIGADLNGNGQLDAADRVMGILGTVKDQGWTDEDATVGTVQLTTQVPVYVGGSLVVQAVDGNGTTVGHVYSLNYTHPGQYIAGTVLNADGTPGAGLLVANTSFARGVGTVYFTDAGGNFVLYLPAGRHAIAVSPNTEGGSLTQTARSVPTVMWLDLAAGEAKTGVHFTFWHPPGQKILGTVREQDTSLPVAGALVRGINTSTYDEAYAFTNVVGQYSLHATPGSWIVATEMRGSVGPYGDAASQYTTVSDSDVSLDLALPRLSNRIYGIVTRSGGIVLPGLRVQAENTTTWDYYGGETNGLGRYEIWAPPGQYQVSPYDDSSNYTIPVSSMRTVTIPTDQRADFTMVPCPYTISGRAVFAGTNTGMPFTEISADETMPQYWSWFGTTTDGQGNYTIKVPASNYDVSAYNWMYDAGDLGTNVDVPPSQTVNFSLTPLRVAPTLSQGGVSPASGGVGGQLFTFSVKYASTDGTPPADVYVVIDTWPHPMQVAGPIDFAAGTVFTYQTTLTTGTHYFWFGALDMRMLDARLPASGSLSVTAVAGGTLSGIVRENIGQGIPLNGATVLLKSGATVVASDSTDQSGQYSILAPSGSYTAVVSSALCMTLEVAGVTVTAGQTTNRDFLLEPSAIAAGKVTAAAGGAPIAGAHVQLTLSGGSYTRGVDTDANGDYRIDQDLPTGTYTIVVSKPYYDTVTRTGVALSRFYAPQDFALTATGKLTGQVRIAGTTTAIGGATVEARLGGVLKGTATTGASGVYEIAQGLSSGTYVVSAGKDGYVAQVKSGIVVTTGATSYVNFALGASGTLMGQVAEKGSGTPIAGAAVKAYLGSVLKASATTAANGVYTISRDLAAGSYVVTASKAGYVTQSKGANITAGATTYLNFNLDKLCLTGQVRQMGTTTALAGAKVEAYQGDVLKGSGTTDADGIYQIGALTTGTYTVIASKTGYVRQTKPGISFTTGAVTYVNFALAVSGKLMGQVWDKVSGAPIIGATVSARTGGVVVATGTTVGPYGIYSINSDLPAGTYTMLCTKSGYNDFGRLGIVVTAGATTYVNFPMQAK
jgi:hypothetical protein